MIEGIVILLVGIVIGAAIMRYGVAVGAKTARSWQVPDEGPKVTAGTIKREKGDPLVESNIFEEAMHGEINRPMGETGEGTE